ncbi:MAG: ribonuclease P protein component [Pigmentiphaga sp.]
MSPPSASRGGKPESAPAGAGFPPSARVRRAAEYQHALRRGRRLAHSEWFQIIMVGPPEGQGSARLGLIVGKRHAPLSVSRQAIKRVWREAFRLERHALPPGDYVVRLQSRIPSLSLTRLKVRAREQADSMLWQAARRASRPRQE